MSTRARVIRRTKEFYSYAVKILRRGFEGVDGKRGGKLFDGFEAADGFNLRYIGEWTAAQKSRVTRAFTAVDKLASRAHKVIRPRNKKNLKRLQQAAQHGKTIKGLKVAFVPVADPENKIKIKYTKSAVKIQENKVGKTYIEFDKEKLITSPKQEIRAKVDANPARVYNVGNEHYFINTPLYDVAEVEEEVLRLQNKYNSDRFDPDDPNSHYHGNWLDGLIGYNYETRADGLDYRGARRIYKEKFTDKRAKHKRKVRGMIKTKRKRRNGGRGK